MPKRTGTSDLPGELSSHGSDWFNVSENARGSGFLNFIDQ